MIKKIKAVHKLVTTANLLAMALIMSAGFCDDDGGVEVAPTFTLTAAKVPNVPKANKEAEVEVVLKVTAGTLDTTKWKLTTKDLKPITAGNTAGAGPVTFEKEDKSIKDAGVSKDKVTEKDGDQKFKIKLLTTATNWQTAVSTSGKITGTLVAKGGKIKDKDGKEKDAPEVTAALEVEIGS